jgi:hypothetical protein
MAAGEVFVQATEYAVCSLPPHHPRARHFRITVEWRGRDEQGRDRWAVCHMGECLSLDGAWDYEPSSSGRDDAWLAAHRFNLDTALRLARQAAPAVTVNNVTAADVAARGAR